MAWDTRLNPVVGALSKAITDPVVITDIATKSGMSMEFVRYSPDADSHWTAVLNRAQDEGDARVDAVLETALTRTESQIVHYAVEVYWKSCGK